MSANQCPQCGSDVPPQARFCGQCGRTFDVPAAAAPGVRTIPTTLDEATADPPSPAAPPAVRVHAGMPTTIGHALQIPAALPGLGPEPAPTPRARAGFPTVVGHAVEDARAPNLGATLYEAVPFGAAAGAADVTGSLALSQRPTYVAPSPDAPTREVPAASLLTAPLAATVADPDVAERAQQIRDEALADARAAAPGPSAPSFGKTILQGGGSEPRLVPAGPARTAAMAATPPGAAGPGSDKHTMLGMPAAELPRAAAAAAPAPTPLPPTMKTMLGVAIPGIAPTNEPRPAPVAPGRDGTLVGVAAPGIAPLRAGHPASQPGMRAAEPPAPIVPPPAPLVLEPLPEAPKLGSKKGVPAVAVVAIVFVLVALIGGGAALLMLRSAGPLTAQPLLDETGKESLRIRCESCPDDTAISLGASTSKVQAGATLLPLPAPLSIGDNDLEIAIDRPGSGRDEKVKIHVPVAYRVKADLSTLTAVPPSITVRAEATPGTEVTIDGKRVSLDASGRGSVAIDVAAEVEGPSDDSRTIDKKVPFTVKSPGAKAPEPGQIVVRAAVIPLHLDAPGLELFTTAGNAAVAGQTRPNGTLTIDGKGVALDAQGRFGVRVELPADGEKTITIVANAPPLAPRTVRAKIVRVPTADAAARTLEARSPLALDAFGRDPAANVGRAVVVEGEVLESRILAGHTVMLIEEKKAACAACVVRVVHGEEVRGAVRGDQVRAHGRLVGTVSWSGKTVPDIEGSLVVTLAKKGKK